MKQLQDNLLDIGIAADFFARLGVIYPDIEFSIREGRLQLTNRATGFVLIAGTGGVEPTASDWRDLMIQAGKI